MLCIRKIAYVKIQKSDDERKKLPTQEEFLDFLRSHFSGLGWDIQFCLCAYMRACVCGSVVYMGCMRCNMNEWYDENL